MISLDCIFDLLGKRGINGLGKFSPSEYVLINEDAGYLSYFYLPGIFVLHP